MSTKKWDNIKKELEINIKKTISNGNVDIETLNIMLELLKTSKIVNKTISKREKEYYEKTMGSKG